jgi:hypothetical protein
MANADFDDLSPHLAVDITAMTADGRPSSFGLALEARHIHSDFLGRLGCGCDCCCSDCFRSAFRSIAAVSVHPRGFGSVRLHCDSKQVR